MINLNSPKVILGLGNPGHKFEQTRHNIGFIIVDKLATIYGGQWHLADKLEWSQITINDHRVLLIKPQTFMNNSGEVIPFLTKKGIKVEDILVVHDELEFPFGKINFRFGGSARGHNGLKSLISFCSENFFRLRFGIGRPENREDVCKFVLSDFSENAQELNMKIDEAVSLIVGLY